MALIKERNCKPTSSGAYERVFDNKELGELISKIQATVIANGNELEKLILELTSYSINEVTDVNLLLEGKYESTQNIFLISKKILKKSKLSNQKEPDFVIINTLNGTFDIIELKEGWVFDTKKSVGEYNNLIDFQNEVSKSIPYKTNFYICSFTADSEEKIFSGFKRKIPIDFLMTGKEFCKKLNIDYENIISIRKKDAKLNLDYFISELMKIEEVKLKILEILGK